MVVRAQGGGGSNNTINPNFVGGAEGEALATLADQLAALGGSSSSSSQYPGPVVYMGREPVRAPGKPEAGTVGYTDNWVPTEEVVLRWNNWSTKRRRDFIAQAKIGGLLDPEAGELEGAQLWRALVEEASYYGINQEQKVSPWDLLSSYVEQAGTTGAWQRDPSNPDFEVNVLTGERRYVGPQFQTATQTSVDFTDPATAAALATSMWQQMLGRDPGVGELGSFAQALRAAEERNPITTTTTTEFDPVTGEAIGQSTVSEGGMTDAGRQYMAEKDIKGSQEYADVQAATTYAGAFEQMVWGAPNLRGTA